jgi:hypothetical protein
MLHSLKFGEPGGTKHLSAYNCILAGSHRHPHIKLEVVLIESWGLFVSRGSGLRLAENGNPSKSTAKSVACSLLPTFQV